MMFPTTLKASRLFLVFLSLFLLNAPAGLYAQQLSAKVSLMQWSNGKLQGPGQDPSGVTWKNGNLSNNNAHIAEGMAVPYRLEVNYDGVRPGRNAPATRIILKYNLSQNGRIAWDYPTSFNRAGTHDIAFGADHLAADFESGVFPTQMLAGSALAGSSPPFTTFPIPQPAYLNYLPGQIRTVNGMTGDAVAANHNPFDNTGTFMIYNGTIQQIRYLDADGNPTDQVQYADIWPTQSNQINGVDGRDVYIQFEIEFTPDPGAADIVILWGMHLATQFQESMNGQQAWGKGYTAVSEINGSPYRVQIATCDQVIKGCGTTPMNIKAGAVVNPPACPTPPTAMVPFNPIYGCEGLGEVKVTVITTNPGAFAGSAQYLLLPFGETNPISPMTEWADLMVNDTGGLYFPIDFTGVGMGAYDFQVKARYSGQPDCESVAAAFSVVVEPDPTVGVSTFTPATCTGGVARLLASPSKNNCHLQWQEWIDGVWQDMPGDTGMMLDVQRNIAGAYLFRVVATACPAPNAGCEAVSEPLEINFVPDPSLAVEPVGGAPCAGGEGRLRAVLTGSLGACELIWEELVDDAWIPIPGQSTDTLTILKEQAGSYRFRARTLTCDGGAGCSAISPTTTLTFGEDPSISIAQTGVSVCAGGTTQLAATIIGDKTPCRIQWQEWIDGDWTDLENENNPTLTVTKPDAGNYAFRALIVDCEGGLGCDAVSNSLPVIFSADPIVEVQAPETSTCAGGSVPLTAVVIEGKDNCRFQWQEFLNNAWINLPGEVNAILNTRKADAGTYRFRVKVTGCEDGDGCASTSEPFELTIRPDPGIQVGSLQATACVGGAIPITATILNANGECAIQWQELVAGVWTDLPERTAPLLSVRKTEAGTYSFRARITNCDGGAGCNAVSNPFELSFLADPIVSLSAEVPSICVGGLLQLTANIEGAPGPCQVVWEERVGENWTVIQGEQDLSLAVSKTTVGVYAFRVSATSCEGGGGCNAVSEPFELTFTPDPTVAVTAPRPSACAGGTLILNAAVTGGQNCAFQWQELIDETWTDLPGETKADLMVSKAMAGAYRYRAIASGCDEEQACNGVSEAFEVIFTPDPQLSISADINNICAGGMVTLTAVPTSDFPACNFQWQARTGEQWFNLPNETNATLTVSRSQPGVYAYRAVVSACVGVNGCNATSEPFEVVFVDDPGVQIETQRGTACLGGEIRLTASPQGDRQNCVFLWQELIDEVWTDLPESNVMILGVRKETAGDYTFRLKIDGCDGDGGCDAVSDPIVIQFVADPVVTIQAGAGRACAGGTIPFTAAISAYEGVCSLQWQEWVNETWVDLDNETSPTLNLTKTTAGTYRIRAAVTACEENGGCQTASEPVEVSFAEDPAVLIQTENNAACAGGTVRLEAVTGEENAACAIQWQERVNDVWVDLPQANRAALFVNKAGAGTFLFRVALNQCGDIDDCAAFSDPFEVVFQPDPRVRIDAADKTACAGGTLYLSAIITGGQGACRLQWEELVGNNWLALPNATEPTLEVTKSVVGEFFYRVQVSRCDGGNDCRATSQAVQLNFEADPTVSVSSPNNGACAGGTVQLAANVNDGIGACQYRWQSFEAGEWVDVPNATTSTLSVQKDAAGVYGYRVMVTACQGNDGCDAFSPPFEVQFAADPTVAVSGPLNACVGGTLKLAAQVENGPGDCDIKWQSFVDGVWKDVTGAAGDTLAVTQPQEGAYTFRALVMGCDQGSGCNAQSAPFTVNFASQPTVSLQPSQREVCAGNGASFTATVQGGASCTQIRYLIRRQGQEQTFTEIAIKDSGVPLNLPADLPTAYVITPATYVVRAETICTITSCSGADESTLVVREKPLMTETPPVEVCSGDETGVVLTLQNPDATDVLEVGYWITAIDAGGLTPVAGSPFSALGVASDDQAISDDAWLNTGAEPVVVSYTVIPRFRYGPDEYCEGNPKVVRVRVRPQPALAATAGSVACSEGALGATLALTDPPGEEVNETYFVITRIESNGLTAVAGDPLADLNALRPADEIADDAWKNAGVAPAEVIYRVIPVVQYDVDDYCYGAEKELRFSILPAPVIRSTAPLTLCSPGADLPEGSIGTGILLHVDNDPAQEGDQPPVPAQGAETQILFRLDAIQGANALTPGQGNAQSGEIGDEKLLWADTWVNSGSQPVELRYRVTPLVIYRPVDGEESICYGAPQWISVTVMPNPSIDVQLAVVGVDYPQSGSCDNFDLLLELEICNNGPVNLSDLAAELDLTTLTNGAVAGLTSGPAFLSGRDLSSALDPNFNGADKKALFLPGAASLSTGECARFRLQLEIAPPNVGNDTEVSGATFRASVVAQGDWTGLTQTTAGFDQDRACYALAGQAETAIGECWWRSRNVATNDLVNVTLDENCQALITPDMLLEGYTSECGAEGYPMGGFYRLVVIKPGNITEGPFTEVVLNNEDFNDGRAIIVIENVAKACLPLETELLLEDKTEPEFGAYDTLVTHVLVNKPVQRVGGSLSAEDDQLNLRNYVCFNEHKPQPDCENDYEVLTFEVDRTDFYTIELSMPGAQGLTALYQGAFDPAEPCANIIARNDQPLAGGGAFQPGDANGRIRIVLPLQAGRPYALLIASTDCSGTAANYEIFFSGDAGGKIRNASKTVSILERSLYYPLLCTDIDSLFNQPASTELIPAPPVLSDCTPNTKWFEDERISNGDCGALEIRRTWYVRDEKGREGVPVVQTIRFGRPRLADVYEPAATVAIECDELQPEMLDENGYPLPSITGYPYIVSAFGIHDLNEAVCNIGASYQEISDIQVCADTRMVVREWILVDWCDAANQNDPNSKVLTDYRQIINLGDFSAPEVEAPADIVIPTTPFGCAGVLAIADLEVSDNCSAEIDIVARVYRKRLQPVLDRFGRETGQVLEVQDLLYTGGVGDQVANIELGFTYRVEYTVSDACGNTAAPVDYLVTVEDKVAPSVICNRELNISVGGDGLGRVHADDVNEGSWDNCELGAVLISRAFANENLRDAYLEQVYDLRFDQLRRSDQPDPSGQIAEIWAPNDAPGTAVLRRKDGVWYAAWREDQWFLCDDIGLAVRIELAAIDVYGNANVCDLTVTIEDKSIPYCVPPPPVRLACTELPVGFDPQNDAELGSLFGQPTAEDNCSATATQVAKTVVWDCNSGTITRTFRATDRQGLRSINTCKQVITVYRVHDYEIKFPRDASAECGRPATDTIATNEIACDLLTVSVVDEPFTGSDDACYVIRRTYKVINWCEYDGESAPVAVSRNPDCDGESGEEDVYVLVRANGATYIDRDNNEQNAPATSPCNNGAQGHLDNSEIRPALTSTGYWTYVQLIKVTDRSAPEITVGGETVFCTVRDDCAGDASFPIRVTDACSGAAIAIRSILLPDPEAGLPAELDLQQPANAALVLFQLKGAYPAYTLSGRFPIGEHRLVILAADGCGNTSRDTIGFRIADCKAPAPVCINGLAIELMPVEDNVDVDGDGDEDTGAMVISANDFRLSNLSDCTEPVTLSINRPGETPDRNKTTLLLTCDDIDTVFVEIYAWDNANNPRAVQPDGTVGGPNYDHCSTYVVVQDNLFDLCKSGAAVSGLITTREDEPVENVQVDLSGQMESSVLTKADGTYLFEDLTIGGDYTVSPRRDDNHRNGVSTFDLILITKHLLRTRPMTDPYQLIAADVNRSNTITALDLIHIRKLLLTIYPKFPASESWRFTPVGYRFPDPSRPFMEDLPEVLNFNDVKTEIRSGDFVGMKVGDVNGSATPNSQMSTIRTLRGVFALQVEEQRLENGRTYRAPFSARDLANIQGYQFTLDFDTQALQLIDVEYGLAGEESFGWPYVAEGRITTSWIKEGTGAGRSADPETPLFTLVFRAKANARLSDLLRISSRYTEAEAYNEADELLDVRLEFLGQNGAADLIGQGPALYQNTPNPWSDVTQIGFYLPEAGEATLSIRDVQGRLLKLIRADFTAGAHRIELQRQDLPAAGVLYYTLETGDFAATRKMVMIE